MTEYTVEGYGVKSEGDAPYLPSAYLDPKEDFKFAGNPELQEQHQLDSAGEDKVFKVGLNEDVVPEVEPLPDVEVPEFTDEPKESGDDSHVTVDSAGSSDSGSDSESPKVVLE